MVLSDLFSIFLNENVWARSRSITILKSQNRVSADRRGEGKICITRLMLKQSTVKVWHLHFGTLTEYCLSTFYRRARRWTMTTKLHYWIDWLTQSSRNGLTWIRKQKCVKSWWNSDLKQNSRERNLNPMVSFDVFWS